MQFSTYTLCCVTSFQILLMKVYCHENLLAKRIMHFLLCSGR